MYLEFDMCLLSRTALASPAYWAFCSYQQFYYNRTVRMPRNAVFHDEKYQKRQK